MGDAICKSCGEARVRTGIDWNAPEDGNILPFTWLESVAQTALYCQRCFEEELGEATDD